MVGLSCHLVSLHLHKADRTGTVPSCVGSLEVDCNEDGQSWLATTVRVVGILTVHKCMPNMS